MDDHHPVTARRLVNPRSGAGLAFVIGLLGLPLAAVQYYLWIDSWITGERSATSQLLVALGATLASVVLIIGAVWIPRFRVVGVVITLLALGTAIPSVAIPLAGDGGDLTMSQLLMMSPGVGIILLGLILLYRLLRNTADD